MGNDTGCGRDRPVPWRRVRLAVGFGLTVGLFAGASHGYWVFLEHRVTEVSEGRLFQSAEMPAEDLEAFVMQHGIRAVFDIRAADEGTLTPAAERSLLDRLGVKYVNLGGDPLLHREILDGFVDLAEDADNLPLLVHCHHGTGRSVLAAAVYRIEIEGWDVERARVAAKSLSFRGAFGPNGPKGRFLGSYRRRAERLSVR